MTVLSFDPHTIRNDFPCLHQQVNGKPLAFLDSAASAQKPHACIKALINTYQHTYANVHRGLYHLSDLTTQAFEKTRKHVASFLNAPTPDTIVFTKGATEGINLVAHGLAPHYFHEGDEIIISHMEHHANIVPWQQLCKKTGAKLVVCPLDNQDNIDMVAYKKLLNKRTKLVAITHMSNVLGSITPIKEIIALAHDMEALTLVDACQSIVHIPINVVELDCDFLVWSAHKLYGPNAVGIVYGKYDLLNSLDVYQTGGEMVDVVSFEHTSFQDAPLKFEAGTPAIAEVIALDATLHYLDTIDRKKAAHYEHELLTYTTEEIQKIDGYTIIGNAPNKASILSFVHTTAHPSDIGQIMDQCGVAIRTGHQCAQPLHQHYGIRASARMSLAIYNNHNDIDAFLDGLHKVNRLFGN